MRLTELIHSRATIFALATISGCLAQSRIASRISRKKSFQRTSGSRLGSKIVATTISDRFRQLRPFFWPLFWRGDFLADFLAGRFSASLLLADFRSFQSASVRFPISQSWYGRFFGGAQLLSMGPRPQMVRRNTRGKVCLDEREPRGWRELFASFRASPLASICLPGRW